MGVTVSISSVLLFSQFFSIIKTLFASWISCSYLVSQGYGWRDPINPGRIHVIPWLDSSSPLSSVQIFRINRLRIATSEHCFGKSLAMLAQQLTLLAVVTNKTKCHTMMKSLSKHYKFLKTWIVHIKWHQNYRKISIEFCIFDMIGWQ